MNPAELHAAVKRYCISLTGSSLEGEDLAQDVWLKAMMSTSFDHHANPEAYLLRVANHIWIDQSRRKTRWSRIMQRLVKEEPASADHPPFEVEMAFQALMKHLSPLQLRVFLLRDVFGYSSEETANMIQTTEGAVKAALHRARQSLAEVRKDLEHHALALPEDISMKALLQAMAAAYSKGDAAEVVRLAQLDVIEPVFAIGVVQSGYAHHSHLSPYGVEPRNSSLGTITRTYSIRMIA